MVKSSERFNMCERPFLKKIIFFSLPLIATSLLQLLYNAADLVVVGRYDGQEALGAVGSSTALINLIINLFTGMAVGALSTMACAIGAKQEKYADAVVHTSIVVSLAGGLLVGLVGFFFSRDFLMWMDAPPVLIDKSALYMQIYFIGVPFMTVYNFGASILRACGDTKRPLIILTSAGLVNVALNFLFVVGVHLGVAGVAIGTTVSQFISAVAVIGVMMKVKGYGHFSFKRLRVNGKALGEILRIGLPAGFQGVVFSFSNVIIQSSINSFDNQMHAVLGFAEGAVVAANSASGNLEAFVYTPMNCVAQSALTFIACNYGAKNIKNMRLLLYEHLAVVIVLGIFLGGLFALFAKPLISIYNNDPEVIKYAYERLVLISLTDFLCGIMDTLVSGLRGIGCSFIPMVASIIGVCGIRIGWIYTIFKATNNLMMLYMSYPASWLITCCVHAAFYLIVRHKTEKRIIAELASEAEAADAGLPAEDVAATALTKDDDRVLKQTAERQENLSMNALK